jgi:tagaturonate reductase
MFIMNHDSLPETVLQFGAGRFVRAFVERFIQNANDAGQAVGRVVVVQSTPGARADLINAQPQGYHVLVRGYLDGQPVERTEQIASIRRALIATTQWPDVLAVARSPDLKYIVTNATEAGYATDDGDTANSAPPRSMPAKLTRVLWERFQAGAPPLVLLPCELIEGNAARLRDIVGGLTKQWSLPDAFIGWATTDCLWLNNLVDCIVTPAPADHPLAAEDKLLVSAEPYALWAVQRPPELRRETAASNILWKHPAISIVGDLAPYYLRKVRILNGLHTAMAAKFHPAGFETVLQVLADREALRWLRAVCFEEIVPTIAWRVEDVAEFADQTFDRFRNPFLAHKLSDILLNHAAKVRVRLQPTHDEYVKLFGRPPRKIAEVISTVTAD